MKLSKIIKLNNTHLEEVGKYIYSNFWPCIELAKIYNKNGLKNKRLDKNSGDFFGFYDDNDELKGLFLFTNNKRFLLNFLDEDVTKKVDLLKAIKHYKPEFMSGIKGNVSLIWKMFERTVKRYKYKDSMYMILEKHNEFIENYVESDSIFIRNAEKTDARVHLNFLLGIEKEFKRNHLTINQLQARIAERENTGEYLFVELNKRIVSQAFIEEKFNAFYQIGGVYTLEKARGNAYGYEIVNRLCKNIIDSGNIPILAVLEDNSSAIKVYEKLSFERKVDFSIIELEF